MKSKIYISLFLFVLGIFKVNSQSYKIHSHNDYEQEVPFWKALSAGATSLETDVFLFENKLLVAHNLEDTSAIRTLQFLYLEPLRQALKLGLLSARPLQLLIDVKSEPHTTLNAIISAFQDYPELLKCNTFSVVISGNRPKPSEYKNYPDFVNFDYQSLDNISLDAWERVALISLDYRKISKWNGKGRFTKSDKQKIINTIEAAHKYHKPFRFWGTPDSKTAWRAFSDLGVDFINTDMPFACHQYVKNFKKHTYVNKLFSEVYTPTFKNDQKKKPVKNIILLIGDGNGLTQISAATFANKGALTLTQLKSIGLIKTQSSDDFTTDSAAAGTALATGEKTYNRAIGVDSTETPIKNITEILQKHHFNTGIITTDNITGATPSAFYAHQKDRDDVSKIAEDLLKSELNLFVGGGKNKFKSFGEFEILKAPKAIGISKKSKIGFFISDTSVPSILEGRGNILAEVTLHSLEYFKTKNQPFLLIIEGAQIDSYGHRNDTKGIISEGIDFDKAITTAIRFADANEGTLVIITADHETSGFSIPQGNLKTNQVEGSFTTYDHTGAFVPVFAYGPHSNEFSGVYENTEIFHKIMSLINLSKKE
jgi:alkaline phosphatase